MEGEWAGVGALASGVVSAPCRCSLQFTSVKPHFCWHVLIVFSLWLLQPLPTKVLFLLPCPVLNEKQVGSHVTGWGGFSAVKSLREATSAGFLQLRNQRSRR